MNAVEKIAAAVLYEGYVLWPYRRSARKNQQRWTLGGVYPRAFSEAGANSDPWLMQTQCLARSLARSQTTGAAPSLSVRVRFLQVVQRQLSRRNDDGTTDFVDELQIGPERYLAWDEATEREIAVENLPLAELETPRRTIIDIPAGSSEETLHDADGKAAGVIVRSWRALCGAVEIEAKPLPDEVFRITVRVTNGTPWSGQSREATLRHTMVSTHTILRVTDGEFISLMDPPESLQATVEACENIKTWPVLAGEEGDKSTLLSSPIILYDYPKIAPESSGDFFDGGEIDQMLVLNILTLTDEEKSEMRATDPRAREILERSESYTAEDFMGLHGAIREFQVLNPQAASVLAADPFPTLKELEKPAPESIEIGGVEVRTGSRVRLCPRAGGDIMDIALAGKIGIIEGIDQDYEDRIHLSVTIEDDPGRELGVARVLGHRFFFAPEEVEPLGDAA